MSQPNMFRAALKSTSPQTTRSSTQVRRRALRTTNENSCLRVLCEQVLPKREDHPELPAHHRDTALNPRKMRRFGKRGLGPQQPRRASCDPRACRKRERERQQLLKERRRRALRKAVFMRGSKE